MEEFHDPRTIQPRRIACFFIWIKNPIFNAPVNKHERNMVHFRVLISLLILFADGYLYSQRTIVSGRVIDAITGEPVSYTSVGFQHSTAGAISETDGSFYLVTTKPTDTLLVSNVGYEMVRIPVIRGNVQEFTVRLIPKTVALEAVVVAPGENPAHIILRHIKEHKDQNNPARLQSYQYKAYTRLRLDLNNIGENLKDQRFLKDFRFVFDYMDSSEVFNKNYLPLLISETVSKVYFSQDPPVNREVIEASKISGIDNKTFSQYTGRMYLQMNIYNNFVNFFDPSFISPIADFGRMYYKYYIEDSATLDDHWCYKISFNPKRKQDRTFHGFFWVADTSFAIKKIQLRISSDVNLNLLKDMIATFEYKQVNDTTWFLSSEEMVIDFNVVEKSYGFFGRKSVVFDSIIFDGKIPESVRSMTTNTYIQEDETDKDESFWESNRKFDLTSEDRKVFDMVDSVKEVRAYKFIYSLSEMLAGYYIVTGPVEIGPYYTMISGNPMEGLRLKLGGRTSNAFSTKLMIGGHLAYGFADNAFKYGSYLLYMFDTDPRRVAYVSYFHDIRQLGKSENAFLDDNILNFLFRTNPNYKLTLVDNFSSYFEREWMQGFSNTLKFSRQTIYATPYVPFEYFETSGDTISNSALTSVEFTLSAHFAYREKFLLGKFERKSLGSDYPILDLDLTYGPKGILGSDWEYYRITLKISDRIETNPLGFMKLRLTAGKVFGTVPYPLLKLHEGNETYVYNPNSLNMMSYYEFVSDEYIRLFAEHHFQGFFLNRIPLIRELHWREVVNCNLLFGHLSDNNKSLMLFPEGLTGLDRPYYEAGVGIENIFRLCRVEAMWRLSHLDHPGISRFGIRFNIQLSF
jgi:hypothetical protein